MSKNEMSKPKISEFSIEVPAKWVLAGEHSVLRGKSALAFPYPEFTLSLTYRTSTNRSKDGLSNELTITANPFQSQIKALLGRAVEWLKVDASVLTTPAGGELEIQSRIPIGAGLGSSAALCVAVARFVLWKTGTSEAGKNNEMIQQWVALATHLEDVFHGKSSGMDVAVIAHSQPMIYSITKRSQLLSSVKKLPRFELFDSGKRGHTRECIEQVLRQPPTMHALLDEQMGQATESAIHALYDFEQNPEGAEKNLAEAMNQAQACFEAWGLVPAELLQQKHELLKQGALAVKLTGAGLGGFWVALWPSKA